MAGERSKREVRAEIRACLNTFSAETFREWNQALAAQLAEVAKLFPPKAMVASYRPMAQEADPSALYSLPFSFCFPRVLPGPSHQLEFRKIDRPHDEKQFVAGYRGISEPGERHEMVFPNQISICIVPLLGFDDEGGRLGHGKGFYDRFLNHFSGLKIGLGFECQRADALPRETHDHTLDLMVTEKKVRRFS